MSRSARRYEEEWRSDERASTANAWTKERASDLDYTRKRIDTLNQNLDDQTSETFKTQMLLSAARKDVERLKSFEKLIKEGSEELGTSTSPYSPTGENRWKYLACFYKRELSLANAEIEDLKLRNEELNATVVKVDQLVHKYSNKTDEAINVIDEVPSASNTDPLSTEEKLRLATAEIEELKLRNEDLNATMLKVDQLVHKYSFKTIDEPIEPDDEVLVPLQTIHYSGEWIDRSARYNADPYAAFESDPWN